MLKAPTTTAKFDSANGSAAGAKKKNHPFYIASLFDVFAQLESDVPGTWGFRNSHMTIVTRDPDSQESMEWVIKGSAYGGLEIVLEVDGVYFLKGRLIALNQPGEQKFFYEPKNQILATSSKDLKGELSNSVSVTGSGIIISREVIPVSPGKDNVNVVVRHTDYNPDIRGLSSFDVEYRCSWSPLMEKLQPLLTPNREVLLIGHIIGKDTTKHMWIVEMTGVSVTSGPAPSTSASAPMAGTTIVTPEGRSRGKMIFDDTPVVASGSGSVSVESKAEAPQTTLIKKRSTLTAAGGPKRGAAKKGKQPSGGGRSVPDLEMSDVIPPNATPAKRSRKGKEKAVEVEPPVEELEPQEDGGAEFEE